jgi:hypothetical protein
LRLLEKHIKVIENALKDDLGADGMFLMAMGRCGYSTLLGADFFRCVLFFLIKPALIACGFQNCH